MSVYFSLFIVAAETILLNDSPLSCCAMSFLHIFIHPGVFSMLDCSELEEMSAAAEGKKKLRTASTHQVKWLQDLVAVHGEDVEAMTKDRRRNVWQKTGGEIRRAFVLRLSDD